MTGPPAARPGNLAVLAAGLAVLFGLPPYAETYLIINSTIFASFAILALSLALIWGYAGILCFGQAAFFGLGGYTYAITAINMGDTTVPAVLAVLCRRCSPACSATSCSGAASATSIWA